MAPETQLRLAREGNVLGVKESCGDMTLVKAVLDDAPPSFRVWSGNDEDTLQIMQLGGYGVISVISHLVGRQLRALVDAAASGDYAAAQATHDKLMPLIDAMFCVTNPIPVKYALNQLGFECGPFRLPMCDPDEASAQRIMAEVRRHPIDLPLPV